MIRGVVFDLFGTLTDGSVEPERETLYCELASLLNVPQTPFLRLMRDTYDARSLGQLGDVRQTLTHLAGSFGRKLDDRTLDAATELRLAIELRLATPRVDAMEVLQALSDRGLAIGVISDCGPETRAIWTNLSFSQLVVQPVFSCEVQLRKPHVHLYELAAQRLGLQPAECLYVGDGGSRELTGALAAGMQAIRLTVPGEDWGAAVRFDPDDEFSGTSIHSLSALLDLWRASARPELAG